MHAALSGELRQPQRQLSTVGGWVFPVGRNPEAPMDRQMFDRWLAHAERKTKLPSLGSLWHPYRRNWTTELRHMSITDVAAR
jgi:hypothetical protein